MDQKVVFITGAAGRLGTELIRSLLAEGHSVAASDLSRAGLARLRKRFGAVIRYGRLELIPMDMTRDNSVKAGLKKAVAAFGRVDVLVNNAYPRTRNYGRKFEKVQYDDFVKHTGMHTGGYFLCSRIFAEYFSRRRKGNIINMASVYGVIAPRFEIYRGSSMTMPVEYAVIKSGIIHLTRYMAQYFKGRNIRVNALSPGGVYFNEPEKFVSQYAAYSGKNKMMSASHVASALIFLVSDASLAVNGQNLVVDEGWSL